MNRRVVKTLLIELAADILNWVFVILFSMAIVWVLFDTDRETTFRWGAGLTLGLPLASYLWQKGKRS